MLTLFANFRARQLSQLNKMKTVFCKCVLEFHFASNTGLEGPISSKKSKWLYPSILVAFYRILVYHIVIFPLQICTDA
jgi:hypothetical protein